MISFFYITALFLCLSLHGFSQQRNTLIACDIPGYSLIKSNNTDNLLEDLYISKPRKCLISDGSARFFFSIRNRGKNGFKKFSLIIYHQSDKVFKTKLPDLKEGEEFQLAFNIKERGVNPSDLKLKIKKKRTYRIYQYYGD